MRTNHTGVTEKAEFNVDRDKYTEGWERIFGKKEACPCEKFIVTNNFIDGAEVTCADCGRVMTGDKQ